MTIAFADGNDGDGNGFADDIAGWDFLDNDNDPFDDVQYGHGTGEAEDPSPRPTTAANSGTCPNCTFIPLRVGDSFVADVNRFAQAAIYAVDNGVLVVQEALGTLNNSQLARHAVDYAYAHGVPSSRPLPTRPPSTTTGPRTTRTRSSSTRWSSTSASTTPPEPWASSRARRAPTCSSTAAPTSRRTSRSRCRARAARRRQPGAAPAVAGLIISAARNAHDHGDLDPHPNCELRRTASPAS